MRPAEPYDVAVARSETSPPNQAPNQAPDQAPGGGSARALWVTALILAPLALVGALCTAISGDPWNALWLGLGTAVLLVGLVILLGVLRWRHGDAEKRLTAATGRGAAAEQSATESRRRAVAAEQHAAEAQAAAQQRAAEAQAKADQRAEEAQAAAEQRIEEAQAAAAEREQQLLSMMRDRLTYLVGTEIPAAAAGEKPDEPAPDDSRLGPEIVSLLSSLSSEVTAAAERAGQEAGEEYQEIAESARLAAVALAQNVQNSAHRVQQTATELGEGYAGTHPEIVEATMGIDHAAAQLARSAQSISVLCGHWPGQLWQEPIALVDVVQSARGRIAAYQRVQVTGDQEIAVVAEAAEPLIHAVAELLANATQSSPPTTPVPVSVRLVQRGAVVEIDDGGAGMDEHRLEEARAIVSGRREVGLADVGEVPQTGLAVVGTYVRQYGMRADLADSPYGGIRAVILIPMSLVTSLEPVMPPAPEPAPVPAPAARTAPPAAAPPASSVPQPPSVPDTAPPAPPAAPEQPAPPRSSTARPDEAEGETPMRTTPAGLPRRTALQPSESAKEPMSGPFAAVNPPDESPQEAGQFLAGILGQSAADGEPGEGVRDDGDVADSAQDDKQNGEWA